ncbi:F-box family protein, partial [Trifolium medium]|nr:F-box family protein [Trifolium medium]
MASGSNGDDFVSAFRSLTEETTAAKRLQCTTSTGTLESPLPTLPFDLIAEILCRLPEYGNNDSWVKLYTVPFMVEQVLH